MGTCENGWSADDLFTPSWLRLVAIEKGDNGGAKDAEDDTEDDEDEEEDGKGEKTFSQADLDALVAKARREERRRLKAKAENGRTKPFDQEKDDEDDDVKSLRRELSELRAEREHDKLMDAAREAAIDAGADPKRVKRFLRLADLDGVKSSDADAIEDAIAEALDENPEFKDPAKSKSSDDEEDAEKDEKPKRKRAERSARDDSNGKGKRQWTRADIAKAVADGTYEKHRDEIHEAVRTGSVK